MENEKWLLGLICAASLIGGFATSLEIARGVGLKEPSPSPAIIVTITHEQPSYYNCSLAASKPASCELDPSVIRYYFEHSSEFAPLPHSPRERAAALRQIESAIRQKLALEQKS